MNDKLIDLGCWHDPRVQLPSDEDEVLILAGAFRHVGQIVTKQRHPLYLDRLGLPYWVNSSNGVPFKCHETLWTELPPQPEYMEIVELFSKPPAG